MSPALFVLFVAMTLGVSLTMVWRSDLGPQSTLFALSNLVGPTAESLLSGRGLSVCIDAVGTSGNPICFHAARMPAASLMIALGIRLLGDNAIRVNLLKEVLLLVPLYAGVYLAWRRIRCLAVLLILLVPFGIATFLSDVRMMQVEEGYSYSLIALAVSILLFSMRPGAPASFSVATIFGATIAGIYLTKSSMLPLAFVLALSYCILDLRAAARAIVLSFAVASPTGWALYQHHASGRISVGTSLDGMNLHKGNNPGFLEHYPPPPGHSLDDFDTDLNYGYSFTDEWSYDQFHRDAGIEFVKTHRWATLLGDDRKFRILFFSVHKYGSSETNGAIEAIEIAGLVIFRLLLWTSILGAAYWFFTPTRGTPGRRAAGGIYLAVVGACVLPYLVGFAYTRHVSILIYPSALMCCRMLEGDTPDEPVPDFGPEIPASDAVLLRP
jgi:hypothetical protein